MNLARRPASQPGQTAAHLHPPTAHRPPPSPLPSSLKKRWKVVQRLRRKVDGSLREQPLNADDVLAKDDLCFIFDLQAAFVCSLAPACHPPAPAVRNFMEFLIRRKLAKESQTWVALLMALAVAQNPHPFYLPESFRTTSCMFCFHLF